MNPDDLLLVLHPDGRLHSVHGGLKAAGQVAGDVDGRAVVLSHFVRQAAAAEAVCRSMHAAGYVPKWDAAGHREASARTLIAFGVWHAASGLPGEDAPHST